MIRIDKLQIEIKARLNIDQNKVEYFGRTLEFSNGLNLVVGDNTSGKTTLVECLFYGLGREELIEGKRGNASLDKAVTKQFSYEGEDGVSHEWMVLESCVFIQISNEEHKTMTLKRLIISNEPKLLNIIYVWQNSLQPNLKHEDCREYYIHYLDDHNREFNVGFYAYLANFAKLPIIHVDGRNTDKTTLYMQTVFCTSYIEQKRGWSDFFANIRSFNILSPKQRLIEYIMGYSSNDNLNAMLKLKEEKKSIEINWSNTVTAINHLLSYNDIYQEGIESEICNQKMPLNNVRLLVRSQGIKVATYITNLRKRIKGFKDKQRDNLVANDNETFNVAVKDYKEHKSKYDSFCIELESEKSKLSNIVRQIANIEKEIKRYKSIAHVNNIVTTMDVEICPTCHQPLPLNNKERTVLTNTQIEDCTNILEMQKKFLQPLKERLSSSIENRELNRLYLEKQLSVELSKIRVMADNNDILSPLSTDDQFELAKAESIVASLSDVVIRVTQQLEVLKNIKSRFDKVCENIKLIRRKEEKDAPIYALLSRFRSLLHIFNYTSNNIDYEVFFKEDDSSYKYFPVVKHGGGFEEEIRSDSSASDFIRSLWAYYLSLLSLGKRHPGFLVMDEPCQHSMKEESLFHLFDYCAKLEDKQTILFCSSQALIERNENDKDNKDKENGSVNIIELLADRVRESGFKVNYKCIDTEKSITLCHEKKDDD